MTNDTTIDAKRVYTKEDSIVAIDYNTNREVHYHVSDVQKIVAIAPAKGALQGMLIGFLVGGSGGAILGLVLIKGKNEIYLFEASMASPSPKRSARSSAEFQ